MKILVLNSGSSSQKACLYEIGDTLPESPPLPLWEGRIDWSGDAARITVRKSKGIAKKEKLKSLSRELMLKDLLATLWSGETRSVASAAEINAVGHRVVHGGPRFHDPVRISSDVHAAIGGLSHFAPLHIQLELEGMKIVADLLGDVPQFAVFDTGFHRHMPAVAQTYPGPYEWFEHGIRRYGFHGINHQYCANRTAQLIRKDAKSLKIVSCHLGNGCSVTGIRGGRSVDTTMGFTPLDGLMMGTRSGSVDPGILIFLMRQYGLDADQIDDMLNKKSGLLGISGLSGDMRVVLARMHAGNERAKLAFDLYIHGLRAAIGGIAAVMEGLDVLVFTAGVGENSPEVRAATCKGLDFLGVTIDLNRNREPLLDADISCPDSRVKVLVIRAAEDWAIAGECWKLCCCSAAVA
ncbi:MAG TPA: acetate kinase [Candidatus Eremiobacteraceae bacterium]|nr:acetate kinase [Candidatus Eremiobacteraceae bacterium]